MSCINKNSIPFEYFFRNILFSYIYYQPSVKSLDWTIGFTSIGQALGKMVASVAKMNQDEFDDIVFISPQGVLVVALSGGGLRIFNFNHIHLEVDSDFDYFRPVLKDFNNDLSPDVWAANFSSFNTYNYQPVSINKGDGSLLNGKELQIINQRSH